MQDFATLYGDHIATLQKRTSTVLAKHNVNGIVIHSGQELRVFLDDYNYPFKINPHFKAWLPITDVPNCYLIINGTDKPTLLYFQPVDFWHKIEPLQESFWTEYFNISIISNAQQAKDLLANTKNYAFIGEQTEVAKELGFQNINPKAIIDYFHYHRAYKTHYEMECLRRSNVKAIKGHQAAKAAFFAGKTEFQINLAYIEASEQTNEETPYGNIIALNENASTLHYMAFNRKPPSQHRSFLIDAGATFHGYASDITRTYSFENNEYSDLIKQMHVMMLKTVNKLQAGISYVDLHSGAYNDIAQILFDFNILNTSVENAIETDIVSTFFPHGLGHHLGLQTHDVGGFMQDENGTHKNTPDKFPFLRTSRKVEANQVFTIEPGLYFIKSLLNDLKNSANANLVNWQNIEKMRPFGGIRIEDNIIVYTDHNENMTRDLGLQD